MADALRLCVMSILRKEFVVRSPRIRIYSYSSAYKTEGEQQHGALLNTPQVIR